MKTYIQFLRQWNKNTGTIVHVQCNVLLLDSKCKIKNCESIFEVYNFVKYTLLTKLSQVLYQVY